MNLTNYLEGIEKQDKKVKYPGVKINEKHYSELIKEILNSQIVSNIEEHLLSPLIKLEPFMSRPLIILYQTLENSVYFSSRIPDLKLKEKVERDYIKKFGENMNFSADCFHHNIGIVINNITKKDFIPLENLEKLKKLGKKVELNELNREIVQEFNNCFYKYKLSFKVEDCNFNAFQARKCIREKYSTEFRNLQREKDLKKL